MAPVVFSRNVFKWAILDKTLLQARRWCLESHFFQITFTSKDSTQPEWYLKITNDNVSKALSLFLCHSENCTEKRPWERPWVVVCTFTIWDGVRDCVYGPKLTATVSLEECLGQFCSIKVLEFDSKFLSSMGSYGSIEVDANFSFLDVPVKTVNEVSVVPPDHRMVNLYEDKFFADVTIKCGDQTFEAHKAILASQSPVFRRMLEVDMKEKSSSVIEIVDIDPSVMSDLLAYLYTGTAPNFNKMAKDLLNAANKYEVSQLFEMCECKLQSELNAANVVETLVLADLHSAPYLKKACLSFIQRNSVNVYQTSQWKSLKQNCDEYSTLLIEILEFMQ